MLIRRVRGLMWIGRSRRITRWRLVDGSRCGSSRSPYWPRRRSSNRRRTPFDQYLDPRGALIAALHDDLDDALQTLANGNVQVLNAAAYSGYPMGDVTYMGAQLIVQVRA